MKKTFLFTTILATSPLFAEIKMPSFFSDGMVLQQKENAPIWGWSEPNTKITAQFKGQQLSTKSDAEGKWEITFSELKASKKGSSLTLKAGKDTKTINDILVGEVWLASGQSNMEWTMSKTNSKDLANSINNPNIRQYVSSNKSHSKEKLDLKGSWKKAITPNTSGFSAVGYHFANKLHQELDVPIAIIEVAWGGRPVESFISENALQKLPEASGLINDKKIQIQNFDEKSANEKHKEALEKHMAALKTWVENGKKGNMPRRPAKQENPATNSQLHSTIFNGMIHPFVGYGIRGAIWYQGESNAKNATAPYYGEFLGCLVNDWRQRWGKEFPFYYVQLANFNAKNSNWVLVQDEMRRALKEIPKTGMAVINDIGAANDIHPKNKKDVGERLARWALAKDYSEKKITFSGPLFKSASFEGAMATVTFDHTKGLKTRDNGEELKGFELAEKDGEWVSATASINNGVVTVLTFSLANPTRVRYAWKDNPTDANLVNGANLPASCFSSDITK